MSDMVRAWLDHTHKIDQAATEGPWEWGGTAVHTPWTGAADWSGPVDDRTLVAEAAPADAEWIAHARTALPKATAALRAVLDLHEPEPYAQGPDYCDECEHQWPCPTAQAIEEALS